jgi:hypothetical protein
MGIFEQAIASLLTAAVTALAGWVYNINSRTTVLETKEKSLKDLLLERHNGLNALLTERFDNITNRLNRIERSLNGSQRSAE